MSSIRPTEDGSQTLYSDRYGEHYHSIHGAVAESMHVFIRAGLHYFRPGVPLDIFEVGLGTGLNVFLTLLENRERRHTIRYTAVELHPVSELQWRQLEYPEILKEDDWRPAFQLIHTSGWGSSVSVADRFILEKQRGDFTRQAPRPDTLDLIYFDAFAPGSQPEMWSEEMFECMYRSLRKGGVLVTYCAKGSVKRSMKAAGFYVERLPGPKGKREMTRAVKT